ncbi:hypothetical protein [Parapedobacter koreensis]|uniref:YD repeat-containing protein n=1 Tax=Parapedobacter koreensis TaxID=332977 RepID=A0A1H7UGA6_9SPHI|nr:hypothetical protein [Parapedobacter koreensis]SEL95277.1 YD repeat-containing protein [Parapedobacter koreensis]
MKTQLLLCCLLMLSPAARVFSQNNLFSGVDLGKKVSTSPEAAMLGKFGDIPIGHYTGTADISIPLYTIEEEGITIPVVLRYHSSGINVEEQASNVGLGWSLEPGGAVIQSVLGVADNMDNLVTYDAAGYQFLKNNIISTGYQSSRPAIGDKVLCPTFSVTGDSYQTFQRALAGHGQPDIYYYTLPGGSSGKFYIHPETAQVVLIDKKEELQITGNSMQWTITNIHGQRFVFQAKETVTATGQVNAGNTWKLSKIILTNGREIDFEYQDGSYTSETFSQTYHSAFHEKFATPGEQFVQPYVSYNAHTIKMLHRITATNVVINFIQDSREDISGTVRRVKSVDVVSRYNNEKIKTFNLLQDYFPYSTVGGHRGQPASGLAQAQRDLYGKRLRLTGVKEIGYANGIAVSTKPPYSFTYNTTLLPLKSSFAKDFWGYFNGKENPALIPDLSFFYYSGYYGQDLPFSLLSNYNGGNRTPEPDKMVAGLLTKVVYPTGGFTEFTYEPHDYTNFNYPDPDKISSANVLIMAEDQNMPYNTKSVAFTLPKTLTVKLRVYLSNGNPQYNLPDTMFYRLLNAQAKLQKIKNGQVTDVTPPISMVTQDKPAYLNNAGISWQRDIQITYDSQASYNLIVELPDLIGPQNDWNKGASIRATIEYMDTGSMFKYSIGGGVRVSAIRNFDQAGSLSSHKELRYKAADGLVSSGLLMSPIHHLNGKGMYFEKVEQVSPGHYTTFVDFRKIWYLSSESYVPLSSSASGSAVGYSRVEEIERAGTANIGKRILLFHNQAARWATEVPEDPDLMNGLLREEILENAAGTPVKRTLYGYENKWSSLFTGVKTFKSFMVLDGECNASWLIGPVERSQLFRVAYYPIKSGWYLNTTRVETDYLDGQPLASTVQYAYNTKGQLIQQQAVDSREISRKSVFVYPQDATTNNQYANLLKGKSMYGSLLTRTDLVDGNEVSRLNIKYKNNGQLVVRDRVEYIRDGVVEKQVVFNKYDAANNATEIDEDGNLTAYILDFNNSMVIAEAANANLNDIAFGDFESAGKGNWTYSGATVSDVSSPRGIRVYNLKNGAISKSGLTSGRQYVLTYWSKGSSQPMITGGTAVPALSGPIRTINEWTLHRRVFSGTASLSIGGSGDIFIDGVLLHPAGAGVKTYTYDTFLRLGAGTDMAGNTVYYRYDGYGNLSSVVDLQGNVVTDYKYNYRP